MPTPRKYSKADEREMVRVYLEGYTLNQVSEAFALAPSTVWKVLQEHSVPIRGHGKWTDAEKYRRRSFDSDGEAEVVELYRAGDSIEAIGIRFDVSAVTVFRTLKRYGIVRRGRGEGGYEARSHAHRRLPLDESAFDVLSADSAYWIGVLMTDGNLYKRPNSNTYKITLCFAAKDTAHLENFRRFMGSGHLIALNKSGGAAYFSFTSRRIAEALMRYGVSPKKSLTAKVCDELAFNRDFWRGCIDGDGTVAIRQPTRHRYGEGAPRYPAISFCGSPLLVPQFVSFARAICPGCLMNARQGTGIHAKIMHTGTVGSYAYHLIAALYSNCTVALSRKLATANRALAECDLIDRRFRDHRR